MRFRPTCDSDERKGRFNILVTIESVHLLPMGSVTALDIEGLLAHAESRLGGTPAEVLGVAEHASNSEACAAFVALAHPFHPNQFTSVSREHQHRAALIYQRLRSALDTLLMIPVADRTPTKRIR